ncbi:MULTISPECIES: phage major capsid protein [Streptomycetaceae]|uniref:Phage-related major capsid protein n=1 Tax=Streptantibioticus cattleyicolor (strain ATCC 35852 / DSM 46488 / JCM 4925 / NBRC 14057 / NRRL 8057) TaxID=1003195 RepID=F8JXC7_STREN|nr:phage major capsid protein [Streptantibioticus cattleyicolor]AEW94602.1 phage-related major capsid protein [Streptantibioticus cattleyicolor NRRL 8057 = DSM 46488]MYS59240.1 phage major capsid protein [Streptomyces sp. SID5468]CCB74959.1 Phage-related major capsid protein [Streptantibioticus cattleyicolor NRRL 8057 = DSM 46488]
MDKRAIIKGLQEQRAELRSNLDGILETVHSEKRSALTEDERTKFEQGESEIRAIDERIAELDAQIVADEAAAEVAKRYAPPVPEQRRAALGTVVTEPEIYRSGQGGRSFFKDLWLARQKGDRGAVERLERNNKVVAEQRAISTVNSAGGEWVPPLWLEEEWIRYVRPGRVTVDLCVMGDVPSGTDSINIPKMISGTAVAPMNGQNTGIQQTDATTGSIASSVVTIAGGQTVSLQLIEQSPLNIDDLILADLAADYAAKWSLQAINGSGSSGQVTGVLTLAGTTSVTWTQSTPALGGAGGLYAKVGSAIQSIHTTRFLPPDAIIMHPRRWAWCETQSDANGRPLVVPESGGPFNVVANADAQIPQGRVGRMLGLPVYVDPQLPTNLGAGTNQDVIIVARMSDVYAWEGTPRAETFEQTYAGNMSVLCRLYNYGSFQAGRYPQSIATITGTGAVTPAF